MTKDDSMNNLTFMGMINRACEDIEFNNLSIDQLKCLLYVAGMPSPRDMEIRPKLLAKLDSQHSTITLEQLSDEYERLRNIKADSSMIQSLSSSNSFDDVYQISDSSNPESPPPIEKNKNSPNGLTDSNQTDTCK